MFRFIRVTKLLLAGVLLSAATSFAVPPEAQAQHVCVWDNGGYVTGRTANVYSVSVYYAFEGQWHLYGRYFATQYSNGWNYGGADAAIQQIRSNGLAANYTYKFWRTTNNG